MERSREYLRCSNRASIRSRQRGTLPETSHAAQGIVDEDADRGMKTGRAFPVSTTLISDSRSQNLGLLHSVFSGSRWPRHPCFFHRHWSSHFQGLGPEAHSSQVFFRNRAVHSPVPARCFQGKGGAAEARALSAGARVGLGWCLVAFFDKSPCAFHDLCISTSSRFFPALLPDFSREFRGEVRRVVVYWLCSASALGVVALTPRKPFEELKGRRGESGVTGNLRSAACVDFAGRRFARRERV